jgi:hypothetical protein
VSLASSGKSEHQETVKVERPADFLVGQDRSGYEGFTIERRLRKALLYPGEANYPNKWVDAAYINVRRGSRLFRTFDAGVYFSMGNSADFGFFPFLGGRTKEVFITQDVPRTGCQWVVSLSPRFRVIFDGRALGLGREDSDFGAIDLDGDGTYEIIVPITDFYEFHDKMSMSDIPLPDIILRYDRKKEKYLPANISFKDYLFEDLRTVPRVDKARQNEFHHRGASLSNLLIYIYAGEETKGWDLYDEQYQLADKEEMRRRVKKILKKQPVYRSVYNRVRKS